MSGRPICENGDCMIGIRPQYKVYELTSSSLRPAQHIWHTRVVCNFFFCAREQMGTSRAASASGGGSSRESPSMPHRCCTIALQWRAERAIPGCWSAPGPPNARRTHCSGRQRVRDRRTLVLASRLEPRDATYITTCGRSLRVSWSRSGRVAQSTARTRGSSDESEAREATLAK